MVKAGKHHAATPRYFELSQTVVAQVEIGIHAALAGFAAVLIHTLHAVAKSQAYQIAIELISPLVVRADKAACVAGAFTYKLHATVCAAVFYHVNLIGLAGPAALAHHHHTALANLGAFVVACFGDFALQAHVAPVVFVEQLFHFACVQPGVGIYPAGRTAGGGITPLGGFVGWGQMDRYGGVHSLQCHPRFYVASQAVCQANGVKQYYSPHE